VLGILAIVSVVIGWYWLRKRWFLAAGAFWALEILFFTTFLTNGQGIGTGVIGSLGYWIDQQEVMRGGQPWYYFYGLVPLYEFLPLILSLAGTIWWLFRRRPERIPGEQIPLQSRFEAFLVFWPLATWAVFTWVGEKMPWHTVYFVTAMAPLAGLWLGRIIGRIDWVEARAKGVFWLMLMTPLLLIVLKALIPPSDRRPFDNVSVNGLSNTAQWVLALIVGLVLVYLIYDRILALGWKTAGGAMVISLSAVLMVLTIGVSYRFSFVNPDMATEPMVYAHGTPDIKLAMDQLEEVSRKTAGGHAVRVAYDDDATWPLEWYLRDYPNKVYYGASPSRDSLDAPVVIVGDKNVGKVKPYLGDRYHEFNYRLIWWPRETYKGLTWERIRGALQDPAQRKQIWDVILHRRYTTPTAQWDPIHRFTFFVRKDVASQVWDWGAPAVAAAGEAAAEDPYAGKERTVAAVQQIGFPGVSGSQPGQFNLPRAVTVDAEGRIYVADSGNHRVQVFAPDGVFLRQWGSLCKTDTQEGCEGAGDGQFNEPWGIAVDAAANVYVSDTWNHRIQHFGPDGQFLRAWGSFASTGGELAEETGFYGPRSVVIGRDGNVYVMDTGNKRVQVFTPDGNQITQWGGGGVVDGTFDEPVGLAQDGDGDWFVADTWNKRIQRFDEAYQYQAQWPISGWASQSVVNKPGLAVDGQRQLVYAADPEGYRILVFGTDGSYKGSFGQYGIDESSMTLPTGVAVGPDGKVYVADGDAHRIMVFPPWE
jgi:DNA-binding beta-propeller fold protein YncE